MLKVIIAGSRGFKDYEKLCRVCDHMLQRYDPKDITIISGTANGADKLGERYAYERGLAVEQFPAQWALLGKRAGYVRNEAMVKVADALIAFWDQTSKGTKHMIDLAEKHNLKTKVIVFQNEQG